MLLFVMQSTLSGSRARLQTVDRGKMLHNTISEHLSISVLQVQVLAVLSMNWHTAEVVRNARRAALADGRGGTSLTIYAAVAVAPKHAVVLQDVQQAGHL